MAGKGVLTVRVVGDTKPLEKSLGGIGKSLAKFGAAAVAVGAAVGGALFKVGSDLDGAFDTIRVGTGATGKALEGLQKDFRAVAKTVPADLGDVGTAIADLNTRTGQTGEGLQDLARRTLELSRLTGTDLQATIAGTTRVFGDWGIAVSDQAATLDELFRASQATGIGVDRLTETVVNFGAPLRQMGFSFEQSIAMLGKFEKEGVNTEAVLGGLKMALGRMAKAGEEPVETFRRLSEQIRQAGSDGEANAIAVEAFGTRAGPDLAAAIREGRFALDDYLAVIEGGSDTILGAAKDTADFGEAWQLIKNNVFLALEPLASRLFNTVGSFAETHGPKVATFIEQTLVPAFENFIGRLQDIADTWGPRVVAAIDFIRRNGEVFIPIVAGLTTAFVAYKAVLIATAAKAKALAAVQAVLNAVMFANPVGLVIAALAGLTAALVTAYRESETFRKIVDGAWRIVAQGALKLADVVIGALKWLTNAALDWAENSVRIAAKAFGWVPDLGPKLQRAAGEVAAFRDQANRALDGVRKNVRVHIEGSAENLMREIARANRGLNSLPRRVSVEIDGRRTGTGVTARQHGGPVEEGHPYLVGERGPELFIPDVSGEILSHSGLARMSGVSFTPFGGDGGAIGDAIVEFMDRFERVFRDGFDNVLRLVDVGWREQVDTSQQGMDRVGAHVATGFERMSGAAGTFASAMDQAARSVEESARRAAAAAAAAESAASAAQATVGGGTPPPSTGTVRSWPGQWPSTVLVRQRLRARR